jgi:hypothetical protein
MHLLNPSSVDMHGHGGKAVAVKGKGAKGMFSSGGFAMIHPGGKNFATPLPSPPCSLPGTSQIMQRNSVPGGDGGKGIFALRGKGILGNNPCQQNKGTNVPLPPPPHPPTSMNQVIRAGLPSGSDAAEHGMLDGGKGVVGHEGKGGKGYSEVIAHAGGCRSYLPVTLPPPPLPRSLHPPPLPRGSYVTQGGPVPNRPLAPPPSPPPGIDPMMFGPSGQDWAAKGGMLDEETFLFDQSGKKVIQSGDHHSNMECQGIHMPSALPLPPPAGIYNSMRGGLAPG